MKKRILYAAFCAFFIVILISSNKLMVATRPSAKRYTGEFQRAFKDPVFVSAEKIYSYDDLSETVHMDGWAFVGTEADNQQKKIAVFFIGQDKNYVVVADSPYERQDVYDAYSGSEYRLKNGNVGFNISFSTIDMDFDEYRIAICDYENPENYGLIYLVQTLIKQPYRIEFGSFQSRRVYVSETDAIADGRVNLESHTVGDDGTATISGWAYVPDQHSAGQTVYVKLTFADGAEKYFDTMPVFRRDVAETLKNDKYRMSGFRAVVPPEELLEGKYTINLIILNEEGFHQPGTPVQ